MTDTLSPNRGDDLPTPLWKIDKVLLDTREDATDKRISYLIALDKTHYFRTLDNRFGSTKHVVFTTSRLIKTPRPDLTITYEETTVVPADEKGDVTNGFLYFAPFYDPEPLAALFAIGEV